MKISVAMCTYNGAKYLQEQIDSILMQDLKVDEIIVCDDGSTDDTVKILNSFDENYPNLFRIYQNEVNLRSVKNFEKAISLCTGDLIFLCDQDDVWMANKTKVIHDFFQQNADTDAVCSNGSIIDENGKELDRLTIWSVPQLLRDHNIEVNYFNIIAYIENIATGAGMACRSKIKNEILPIPIASEFHHDEWIALISSRNNAFEMLDEKLFKYRIHNDQQVGGVAYINDAKTKNRLLKHFDLFADEKTFSQYKKLLKRLSQSYYKHSELSADRQNRNHEISEKILMQSKNLFIVQRENMSKKFPFRFFILNLADRFSNKRKII